MSEEHIEVIMRQTNYNRETAIVKLQEHNNNHITVIKEFMGIPIKKTEPVKSLNQEIYKQLRYKLDASMKEYNTRKEN